MNPKNWWLKEAGQRASDCVDSYISVLRAHDWYEHGGWGGDDRRRPIPGRDRGPLHRRRGAGRGSGRTARASGLDPLLGGALPSSASQGPFPDSASVAGGTVFLCCGGRSVIERLARESASSAVPARRTLTWRPYLWSPWNALVGEPGAGQFFVIALLQDDEEDGDQDEASDLNGVVVVRSEAIRPDGLRRAVEALVAREPGDPEHGIPASVRVLRWREVR